MDLGVRQIRTSGKGSGSVELTLPRELRHLVGLPCRITLHDGVRPDIVLQPDLTAAFDALSYIWRAVLRACAEDGAARGAERFPAAAFAFGLRPLPAAPGTPYLSWQDGLAVASGAAQAGQDEAGAAARCIAACATQYAAEIDIAAGLAAPFGAVCGFLACGTLAYPAWQEACDIAASQWHGAPAPGRQDCALAGRIAWQPGAAWRTVQDALCDRFWRIAAPGLVRSARLFAGWSAPGSAYPALCAAWRRGRSIELNRG
jgi:hypothetical protein